MKQNRRKRIKINLDFSALVCGMACANARRSIQFQAILKCQMIRLDAIRFNFDWHFELLKHAQRTEAAEGAHACTFALVLFSSFFGFHLFLRVHSLSTLYTGTGNETSAADVHAPRPKGRLFVERNASIRAINMAGQTLN